jgi:hypothetical protein
VLSFFSSRWNWASPTPQAAGECAPQPFGPGGTAHTLAREELGESDEGTCTVVLYMYYVISRYCPLKGGLRGLSFALGYGLHPTSNAYSHGRMNYKDTKPYNMSAFLSVDLLTDFAAFCLTDFIDWRYITHGLYCISTQLMNCCPHVMDKGTILVYCGHSTVPSL